MGLGFLVGLASGAYNAYQGGKQQKEANRLQAQAIAQQERQYAERAPFRDLAGQMVGRIEQQQLPSGFGQSSSNPFARQVPSTAMQGLVPLGVPSQSDLDRRQQAAYFDNRAAQENGGAVSRMRAQMFRQIADASRNGGQR